jgi:predicted RNA-binding Zn ribbon-like protein
MSGQSDAVLVSRRPQPGGRPSAPGRLALVQAFINTHFDLEEDRGADLLASPEGLVAWLRRAGLLGPGITATQPDLWRALTVREGLRALARDGGAGLEQLDRAGRGAAVEVRMAQNGELRFIPAPGTGACGALGVLLATTAVAMADGSWSRLKVCPGEHCGWAFYDGSRNRSGRWCSMSVCGGRAKARTHYRRHAPPAEGKPCGG